MAPVFHNFFFQVRLESLPPTSVCISIWTPFNTVTSFIHSYTLSKGYQYMYRNDATPFRVKSEGQEITLSYFRVVLRVYKIYERRGRPPHSFHTTTHISLWHKRSLKCPSVAIFYELRDCCGDGIITTSHLLSTSLTSSPVTSSGTKEGNNLGTETLKSDMHTSFTFWYISLTHNITSQDVLNQSIRTPCLSVALALDSNLPVGGRGVKALDSWYNAWLKNRYKEKIYIT